MQARAAVMPERHGRWTIETLEVAEPGPQEVLVRVVASGICQTDVHARDGFFPIPCPAVYGHEGAGVVEQVGSAVTTLKPGDHVLLANPSCGACPEGRARGWPVTTGSDRTDSHHRQRAAQACYLRLQRDDGVLECGTRLSLSSRSRRW